MHLTHLHATNFLALRQIDLDLSAGLVLIAGPNESGKSSLADAIRFALAGGPIRGHKTAAELKALITEGGQRAHIHLAFEQAGTACRAERSIPGGKGESDRVDDPCAALPYLLDMHAFAAASGDERRSLLFRLARVGTDRDAIVARLQAKGHAAEHIDGIAPYLRSGFDTAAKEAQAQARDAKAAWKATTGETWGSVKGEDWAPEIAPDFEDAPVLERDLAEADAERIHAFQERGRIQQAQDTHASKERRLSELRRLAENVDAAAQGLAQAQAHLAELETARDAAVQALAAAKANKPQPYHTCPHCGGGLQYDGHAMVAYDPPDDPQRVTPEQLFELHRAADTATQSVVTATGQMRSREARHREATQAADIVAELERELAAMVTPADGLAELDARLMELQARHRDLVQRLHKAQAAERGRAEAVKKARDAAGYHRAVLAWARMADDLSPAGIPAELLADAMGPVNAALERIAIASGWPRVRLDSDRITYGHRAHALCSESARWRADAMIAAMIAHLSGLGWMVLDRLDVLDLPGRAQALRWLYGQREQVQTIAMATLKSSPAVPSGAATVWLGDLLEQDNAA